MLSLSDEKILIRVFAKYCVELDYNPGVFAVPQTQGSLSVILGSLRGRDHLHLPHYSIFTFFLRTGIIDVDFSLHMDLHFRNPRLQIIHICTCSLLFRIHGRVVGRLVVSVRHVGKHLNRRSILKSLEAFTVLS